jgi:3-oxoacyl-[acyl-carrier-protein] synthase II
VLASAVAVWFRLGGPNLMICAGATSGLDAVAVGVSLLRAGRADRVVVVGAEPDDEVASAVHARRAGAPAPLRSGAACVVLEQAAPGLPRVGPVGVMGEPPPSGPARLVFAPGGGEPSRTYDVARFAGDLYGALGVAQTAFAAALVGAGGAGARATVVCGDAADGWRALEVVAPDGR